ncbi:MAG: 3-methyl-2-oxobutanoate hydroxymethyltransferase, partial [Treponema sp.]|nr:3-methyl-2-oxobutanoate hydroxymethyltransferase [Treponema sp.]
MAKLTIQELKALKGKRQIIVTTAEDANTAKACELAGVDNIVAFDVLMASKAAPNVLITGIISFADARISDETTVRRACGLINEGASLVYTMDMEPKRVEILARQSIGCVGHVGLVPYLSTWFGGFRAVGKTAREAIAVYEKARTLQDAGIIAIEMECIPSRIASEISKRLEILVFSMGSGPGCDGQYLFSSDLFGSHDGHYPRHAIKYGNFFNDSIKILKQFKSDVECGAYPAD